MKVSHSPQCTRHAALFLTEPRGRVWNLSNAPDTTTTNSLIWSLSEKRRWRMNREATTGPVFLSCLAFQWSTLLVTRHFRLIKISPNSAKYWQDLWVQVPALPWRGCGTLGKSCELSGSYSFPCRPNNQNLVIFILLFLFRILG